MKIDFDGTHLESFKGTGRKTTPAGLLVLMGLPVSFLAPFQDEARRKYTGIGNEDPGEAIIAHYDTTEPVPYSGRLYYVHPTQANRWIKQTFIREHGTARMRNPGNELTNRYSYSLVDMDPTECTYQSQGEQGDCYCEEQEGYDDDDYTECSVCQSYVDPDMCQAHHSYH